MATVEVRWFLAGAADDNRTVLEWFENAHLGDRCICPLTLDWNERTDTYLLIPNSDDMGIKWREEQLQIKGRVASLGVRPFGEGHEGVVERWVKWSYASLPPAFRSLFQGAEEIVEEFVTVPVRKRRALRRVRLEATAESAIEVSQTDPIARGLGFEFTEIEVGGERFCSVAFEGFPGDPGTVDPVADVVTFYLNQLAGVPLRAAESCSYPALLANLM